MEEYTYLLHKDKDVFQAEKLALYNNNNNISLIVENMLPASYLPFLHNDSDKNTDLLDNNYASSIDTDDYLKLYDGVDDAEEAKLRCNDNLNNSIKNLNMSSKCYNSFKIDNLVYVCIISWFVVFYLILNFVYYYYKDYYTYIVIFATIVLLLIAVVFKMVSTISE